MTMCFAVAWAILGMISTRLNRIVTWSCELELAGLTALHDPLAMAAYSPPGALSGGVACTVAGGLGSVTYSQAALAGGVPDVPTAPCGHASATRAPLHPVGSLA